MMDADARALKEACRGFEAKYGIEAFLDTMAAIMQDRLGAHGLAVQFDDSDGCDCTVPAPLAYRPLDANGLQPMITDESAEE
jgi:hypothetical protein